MTGYGKGGKVEPIDSYLCLAKENAKAKLWYVRFDRQTNALVHPDDPMNETNLRQKIKGTAIERCPFISVGQNIYDFYILFLKSGNQSNLTQANRLLRGGPHG